MENYCLTDAGDIFLLGDDIGTLIKKRLIDFATHTNLTLLWGACTWLSDATFAFSPPNFDQILVIHVLVDHQTLPLAFLLIENHAIPDYFIALNMLRAGLD